MEPGRNNRTDMVDLERASVSKRFDHHYLHVSHINDLYNDLYTSTRVRISLSLSACSQSSSSFSLSFYNYCLLSLLLSISTIIIIIRGIFHQIPSLLFLVLSSLSSSRSFVGGGGGEGGGGGGYYGCCRTRLNSWTGFAGRTNFAEFIHKDSNPNRRERYHQKHKLIVTWHYITIHSTFIF